ncbi:MAG: endoglucanase family protein [Chloroflexi bacterium]|nr:endoglucanase family protein [Chloroflexota bacterium]
MVKKRVYFSGCLNPAGSIFTHFALSKFPRLTGILLVVLFSTLALTALGQAPAARAEFSKNTLLGMAYLNNEYDMELGRAYDSWLGKNRAVIGTFTNWEPDQIPSFFSEQLPNIWAAHAVPLIAWQPFFYQTPPSKLDAVIAQGRYDAYINHWADNLKTFLSGPDGIYGGNDDRRVYLRMAPEMNCQCYAWGAAGTANTPADYIDMWRHVHGIFDSKGLNSNHLQWLWTVDDGDAGGYRAEQYYPGDAFVNWVGVDSYNWGTSQDWSSWLTPEEAYTPMLTRLRALTSKPVVAAEVSSSTAGGTIAMKSNWIASFLNYATTNNIQMICWFNIDQDTDWMIFGGAKGDAVYNYNGRSYNVYSKYKQAAQSSNFIGTAPGHPRLLTDLQFSGGLVWH